jgi:hypothetical protein
MFMLMVLVSHVTILYVEPVLIRILIVCKHVYQGALLAMSLELAQLVLLNFTSLLGHVQLVNSSVMNV